MEIIAQILGISAVITTFIIYQQKTRKRIIICKTVQDICWFLHFYLIGASSAAATSFICISRSLVYANNDKKIFSSKLWPLAYITFYAASAALTWSGFFSIFPALSSILSTVAYWLKDTRKIKTIAIAASLCNLVYNITVSHSLSVYVSVAFTVSSALISIFQSVMEEKRNAAV